MGERRMTDFGKRVYALAAEKRDIYKWSDLARALNARGYQISRQQITNYVYGDSPATPEFAYNFALEMDLDEEECKEFAYLWAYHQERKGKGKFRTYIYDVAERLGWDEGQKKDSAFRYIFGSGVLSMSA